MVLVVKNLLSNAGDTRDVGLIPGSGRPLEEVIATHSSIVAWKIPEQKSLVGYSPRGHKESDTTKQLSPPPTHTYDLELEKKF